MSAPVWVPPQRRRTGDVGVVVALVLLGVLFLVTIAILAATMGAAVIPGAAVLAFVPLAVVVAAILWVDRWEPEPWPALGVAFGWGASVSVLVALVLNTGAMLAIAVSSTTRFAEVVGAAVVAPVVEETIKGLGVLLLFLVWRRYVDGPVDGLVYAATVAAGFAFVENILYFGEAMSDQQVSVATVFVLRGVMSPFAHVVFTACVGLALGWAARRPGHAWVWAFPLGLVAAMVLHGLWNASAVVGDGTTFLVMYLLVQAPVFGTVVGLAVWLRRTERTMLRERLGELVAAGRLGPEDVDMLTSLRNRRAARGWAARYGRAPAMRRFQHAATRLAFARNRAVLHRQGLHGSGDEAAALAELEHARALLWAPTGAV